MRHHHCGGLPSQGGWHPVSSPQHLGSGDLALAGVPLRLPGSAVLPGLQLRPHGRPVSPSPAPPFRVVAQPDRISFFEKSLVGPNSFICQLRRSSLFDLLLAIPGSDVSRHGRVSPVLGRSSGLRVPSGDHPSACSRVAPGLHGDRAHPVAPPWAQRPWFSDLLQLSLAPPVFLRPVKASCACLGLVIFPRISVGSGFMPGDSPAISQSRWLLLRIGGAVFAGASSILVRSISGAMVHLSWVVSQQWPFCLSSYLG